MVVLAFVLKPGEGAGEQAAVEEWKLEVVLETTADYISDWNFTLSQQIKQLSERVGIISNEHRGKTGRGDGALPTLPSVAQTMARCVPNAIQCFVISVHFVIT